MALLCSAVLALPCAAQEGGTKDEVPEQAPPETEAAQAPAEAPPPKKKSNLEEVPMHRWGAVTLSLGVWEPQQVGLNDEVAVVVPSNAAAYPLVLDPEASWRGSVGAAYHLPKGMGSVVVKYDSMNSENRDQFYTPGIFDFLESQGINAFSGVFDDGFADGVQAHALNKTREFRLDYQNVAWETPRTHATWGAGVRSIDHSELLEINYLALVPNFPPLIPPINVDAELLAPRPDTYRAQSDFSATGVGVSLDVEFKFHPRFSIVSGLAVGLLTGKMSSKYETNTFFYVYNSTPPIILTQEELFFILESGSQADIDLISQDGFNFAAYTQPTKQAAQTYEAYVGVQTTVWRGLKIYATFREMYYSNVGERLSVDSTIESASRSVNYEGYLVGVSWRF